MLHLFAIVLFVAAFLLPNHYSPWVSFYSDFAMGLALLCLLAVTLWSRRREPLALPRVLVIVLLMALVPLLQYGAGLIYFAADAWLNGLYLLLFFLACVTGYGALGWPSREQAALYLTSLLLACALLSGVLALCQWLSVHASVWLLDVRYGAAPFANIGQPNNLATLLAAGLMSLAYLYRRAVFGGAAATLVALFLLFALALTESRTGVAFLCFLVPWWLWKGRRQAAVSGWAGLALAVAYLAFFIYVPVWSDAIYLSEGKPAGALVSSEELRWTLWQSLLAAVGQQPWFGYGWGQVSVAQLHIAHLYADSAFTEHAHNLLVDLVVWNGLPLGLFLIAVLLYWGVSRAKACRDSESWCLLSIIGLLAVHSLLEFPLDYLYFLVPCGLLIGLVEAGYPHRYRVVMPKAFPIALSAVVVVLGGLIFREYRVLENDHLEMRMQSARIYGASPGKSFEHVYLLDNQREFIRFALTEAKRGMTDEEIEWMRKITYRYAYPPVLFRYFLVLAFNDRQDEACEVLRKLKNLHRADLYHEALENIELMKESYPEMEKVCQGQSVTNGIAENLGPQNPETESWTATN